MKLYSQIIQVLSLMVQWFKRKLKPEFKLLSLNDDALLELQKKSFDRLYHYRKDTATQIIEDILYVSYQRELIGAHKIPHNDQYGFARHLGRVDAIMALIRNIEYVKSMVPEKNEETKRRVRRSEASRPII